MDTLTEEFRTVALEIYESENWRNKNDKWSFLHFQPTKNPIQGTKSEIVLFSGLLKYFPNFKVTEIL